MTQNYIVIFTESVLISFFLFFGISGYKNLSQLDCVNRKT